MKLPVRRAGSSAFTARQRGTVARGASGCRGWGSPPTPVSTTNQQPAAAKVLAALLEKLRSASAQGRRGRLAVVRTLTEKGGA